MAIEIKDVVGWLITGGLGAAGLILNLLTRRDAKRKAKQEAEAIWSLQPDGGQAPDARGRLFSLTLADWREKGYRLSDMRVVEPKGAVLAPVDWSRRTYNDSTRRPGAFSDRIVFDHDMIGGYAPGARSQPSYASASFFADWPSATERKKRSRLVVVISVEEISSSRRESRVKIRSQPIDWIVRAPASAT